MGNITLYHPEGSTNQAIIRDQERRRMGYKGLYRYQDDILLKYQCPADAVVYLNGEEYDYSDSIVWLNEGYYMAIRQFAVNLEFTDEGELYIWDRKPTWRLPTRFVALVEGPSNSYYRYEYAASLISRGGEIVTSETPIYVIGDRVSHLISTPSYNHAYISEAGDNLVTITNEEVEGVGIPVEEAINYFYKHE